MKARNLIAAATAAVLMSPFAMAQDPAAAPMATDESCATLQTKFDTDVATAQSTNAAQAQSLRDEGAKLCAEGRTDEGIAKLKEALSQLTVAQPDPAAPTS
jgi:hypothetical protein